MRGFDLHNVCWVAAIVLVLVYAFTGEGWALPVAVIAGAVGELLEG